MNMKNKLRHLCALCLTVVLLAACWTPAAYADEGNTIHIRSEAELKDFAGDCALDVWSRDKTVVLDTDLTLQNAMDYLPIPTFGGSFDGGGHTIRGVDITDSVAPAGLFGVVQEGGRVANLRVEGTVAPTGDRMDVGGIAGRNDGTIEGCTFTGTVSGRQYIGGIVGENGSSGVIRSAVAGGAVFGETMTGGIAGSSAGQILSCRSEAYVNAESSDSAIDLEELELTLDLSHLTQLNTGIAVTDTGGIAGYSRGIIAGCENRATVGYRHIGYNTGGIVGRSCGQILLCVNSGTVCGRKDVGGIAGQMDPYVQMELSESFLHKLNRQVKELSALVNQASADAENSADRISSQLDGVSSAVSHAAQELDELLRDVVDGIIDLPGQGTFQSGWNKNYAASDDGQSGTDLPDVSLPDVDIPDADLPDVDLPDIDLPDITLPDTSGLISAIHGIGSQVDALNSAASGAVGTMSGDLRAINNKFNEVSDTMLSAISTMNDTSDVITDTSQVDIDKVTRGKNSQSRNEGTVYGDVNTGGITGSMAVEYELDPEDDISSRLSTSYRRQYEYKAIVESCVNDGVVSGKRSYVGGICGRMDLGLITQSESYGGVSSDSGSYVGGIAGLTGTVVRDSYAKCTLSGKRYVGGIVGAGLATTDDGAASTVTGCYALVDITDCQQYEGAIAGINAGEFADNHFVSETQAAINRQSYAGRAESMTYEALCDVASVPERMKTLTLTFVADGKTLLQREFAYGDSFDSSILPELPEKEGLYGHWDRSDLRELRMDTVVTAVYDAYMPGLASEQTREDGRPVILAEGLFNDGDTITVTEQPLTPEDFGIGSGSFSDRLSGYYACRSAGQLPLLVANRQVLEQWQVWLPDSGSHTIRYLPTVDSDRLWIYVRSGDGWQQAECAKMGSYLTFPAEGEQVIFAAVTTVQLWWIGAAAAAVFVVLVVLVLLLGRRKRRKKAALPPQPEQIPVNDTGTEPTPAETADTAEDAGKKPGKKRRWWLIAVAAAALVLAAIATVVLMNPGLRAYRKLSAALESDSLVLDAAVTGTLEGQSLDVSATVQRTKVDGTVVTVIGLGGVTLYDAGGTLYLENGRSYGLDADLAACLRLPAQTAALYRRVHVTYERDGDGRGTYYLTAQNEDAAAVWAALLPEDVSRVQPQEISAVLSVEKGRAAGFCLTVTADGGETPAIQLEGEFRSGSDEAAPQIPDAVQTAIRSGDAPETLLGVDTLHLLQAWAALRGQDTLAADMTLSADCGTLVFRDTVQYDQRTQDGQTVGCVRRNDLCLYFTDNKLCDAQGNVLIWNSQDLQDSAKLVELAYQLVLNGDVSCTVSGGKSIYAVTLDETGASDFAAAIAPASKALSAVFTGGGVELTVNGSTLESIQVSCRGTVHVAVADITAALGAQIRFVQRNYPFSQQALTALQ